MEKGIGGRRGWVPAALTHHLLPPVRRLFFAFSPVFLFRLSRRAPPPSGFSRFARNVPKTDAFAFAIHFAVNNERTAAYLRFFLFSFSSFVFPLGFFVFFVFFFLNYFFNFMSELSDHYFSDQYKYRSTFRAPHSSFSVPGAYLTNQKGANRDRARILGRKEFGPFSRTHCVTCSMESIQQKKKYEGLRFQLPATCRAADPSPGAAAAYEDRIRQVYGASSWLLAAAGADTWHWRWRWRWRSGAHTERYYIVAYGKCGVVVTPG